MAFSGAFVKPFRPAFDAGLAAAAQQQPYLLNFANYTVSAGAKNCGREFQVAVAASFLGVRLKSYLVETINIRLWRTDTQAEVASKTSVAVVAGENIIAFAAAVPLLTTLTYRLTAYFATTYYMVYTTADHPDGPVTILTSNPFVYNAGADAYPANAIPSWSYPIEPTILA